ncbi:multicopper oxidase domain-containing protein [Micromonospora sp. U56]|uniref:multicopper oxidase domain-containing protein n=1 Tax=Micromonospora sp. U56 TaxID=2824900 RepID=UPI001B360C45|nr:multicopper oxidase domain-containing protein [Micromonospora sp. U56]MBQ0895217.1 multicopper oxidase domain-containing protein [Micromonospora sp. U56]
MCPQMVSWGLLPHHRRPTQGGRVTKQEMPDGLRRLRGPGRVAAVGLALVLLLGAAYGAGAWTATEQHSVARSGHGTASADPELGTEDGHDHSSHEGTHGEPAVYDPAAVPAAGFRAREAVLAPAPAGGEHRITLTVRETVLEVAPGVRQRAWTYNGAVPGPTLRGRVGDRFVVTLVNDGSTGHSVDFHASQVAPMVQMRTIAPGERLTYRFTAERAGAFLYHCGSAPAVHHVGNGMFGAIIIDPAGLPPVDQEFVIVQSELALGPRDGLAKVGKLYRAEYDAVVFNGYAGQYRFAPLTITAGFRTRVWVVDAGPSASSAFHVVGTVFDTVFKEGTYVLRPDATRGGAQVLDLAPAQGGFVEFTFAAPGDYPMLSHRFADATRGASGLFRVSPR